MFHATIGEGRVSGRIKQTIITTTAIVTNVAVSDSGGEATISSWRGEKKRQADESNGLLLLMCHSF